MFDSIKNLYNDIEKEYLEFEDKLLDKVINTYKNTEEFFNKSDLLLPIDGTDKISIELKNIRKYAKLSESLDSEEWVENLKLLGTTLGHFNEGILKKLSQKYDVEYNTQSIAKTINNFENIFTKATIFDLKSLNVFRNRIVHYNEYSYNKEDLNLLNIDILTKNIYNAESLLILAKAEKIYFDILQ